MRAGADGGTGAWSPGTWPPAAEMPCRQQFILDNGRRDRGARAAAGPGRVLRASTCSDRAPQDLGSTLWGLAGPSEAGGETGLDAAGQSAAIKRLRRRRETDDAGDDRPD